MTSRIIVIAGGLFVSSVWVSCALADDFANQNAALEVIKKAANDICYTVPQEGSRSDVQLSGDARAELDTVIAKVVDLGIKGAGQYKSEEYRGVLQEELATAMKTSSDCKLNVFNKLVNKMLGWRPPASQSTINQIGDFISEGEQISNTFLSTNNPQTLITQYMQWSSNIEKYLAQMDAGYAPQFRSVPQTVFTRTGMNEEGKGTWQKLQAQYGFLSQLLTELRRS